MLKCRWKIALCCSAGEKERYADVPVEKSAMLHCRQKRAPCCMVGKKECYVAMPVKKERHAA
jgi:hypothetical protein